MKTANYDVVVFACNNLRVTEKFKTKNCKGENVEFIKLRQGETGVYIVEADRREIGWQWKILNKEVYSYWEALHEAHTRWFRDHGYD